MAQVDGIVKVYFGSTLLRTKPGSVSWSLGGKERETVPTAIGIDFSEKRAPATLEFTLASDPSAPVEELNAATSETFTIQTDAGSVYMLPKMFNKAPGEHSDSEGELKYSFEGSPGKKIS